MSTQSLTSKSHILIQLDTDPQPSVFDGVVAVDAGVDQLFQYGQVSAESVESLVHGAIFTRSPKDLRNTAIFVGGSNVPLGEKLLETIQKAFFGPLRVSVMLDANGCNTTAAAAVLVAERHCPLPETDVAVLAGTGPVGRRAALMLAEQGAKVHIGSRLLERARQVCDDVRQQNNGEKLIPFETSTEKKLSTHLDKVQIVISAGAFGIQLMGADLWQSLANLQVVVDLNAVPPMGIEEVEMSDQGETRSGVVCYGAIGVGGLKMKIHKQVIRRLFERNDQVLDAREIYAIGKEIVEA